MINTKQILAESKQILMPLFDSGILDTEVLVASALGWRREQLYIKSEVQLSNSQLDTVRDLIQRRKNGEPVAYIVGKQEFWSIDFFVDTHTLIPRPETEHLVEVALLRIPAKSTFQVLDLGTGSGAIALSLASERPKSHFVAVDFSAQALLVASKNLAALGVDNVTLMQSDWYSALKDSYENSFDVIVTNPPYIANDDEHLKNGDVVHEPQSALIAADDGLSDIKIVIENAKLFLKPGASLMIEHGWQQAPAVRNILEHHEYSEIYSVRDLANIERLTCAVHIE